MRSATQGWGDVGPALIFRKANRHNRMVAADWACALRQDAAALTVAATMCERTSLAPEATRRARPWG